MSQSPDATVESDAAADYVRGWTAINKLMRRGWSWSGHEKNCAFLNLGEGRFADVSAVTGFDFDDDARALAAIDWDFDGDLDLFVTNRNAPRVRFLENRQGTGNRFVALRLRGTSSNADGIGARVEVFPAAGRPERLVRSSRAGEGYLSQSSAWLTFGLGGRDVERVVVRWPGGEAEEFAGVEAGGFFVLEEGSGSARPWEAPAVEMRSSGPVSTRKPSGSARVVLAQPVPMPRLGLRAPDGQFLPLFGIEAGGEARGTGRPVLLNVWASWCPPCIGELREFTASADELRRRNVAFLALSVDEDVSAAQAALDEVGWPFPWGVVEDRSLEILDTLQGVLLDHEIRLALPTSFLVDAEGKARVLYTGPVTPEQLFEDLTLLGLPAEMMRDEATPFEGTWYHPVPETDLALLERKFHARGLADVAREYGRAQFEFVQRSRGELLAAFGRRSAAEGRFDEAVGFLRDAVEAEPDLFQAHFDLGVILHRQGKLGEAITAYGRALALQPENEDLLFNLGLAFLGQENTAAARRQLDALKELESPLAPRLEVQIRRLEEG